MTRGGSVQRHSVVVRICHWGVALSGFLLVFSGIGFMPLYGRFFLNEFPGLGWVSDFRVQMDLHYYSAAVFLALGLFHLTYHSRRQEFSLLPRRGDVRESVNIVLAMLAGRKEPDHDKYLAEQRIFYVILLQVAVVLVLSGYSLTLKNSLKVPLDPGLHQLLVLVHHGFTYIFVVLIVLHVGAFLLGANRPLLASMLHGRVGLDYACSRHAKWVKSNKYSCGNNLRAKD